MAKNNEQKGQSENQDQPGRKKEADMGSETVEENTADKSADIGVEEQVNNTGGSGDQPAITMAEAEKTEAYLRLNDKFLRLAAEFENYKKRMSREFSRLIETAESDLIFSLLDVVDDFSRALSHDTDNQQTFKQGTEMIYNKLLEILTRRGLEQIKSVGENFDPTYHEAVMQRETGEVEEGVILEEVQKGYFHNGKVLRPARVIVAKKSDKSSEDKNEDQTNNRERLAGD